MAMGIVTEEELELEINRLNGKRAPQIIDIQKGRGEGSLEVPESLKKIIGETNEIDGRSEANKLARMFDISSSSVSAYANGATSTASYNEPNSSIREHINKSKERIANKARSRLFSSLKHITEDKLSEAKVEVLASVARNMSAIVKDMEPPASNNSNENNGIQFIFYSPQFRSEKNFDVIDMSSE